MAGCSLPTNRLIPAPPIGGLCRRRVAVHGSADLAACVSEPALWRRDLTEQIEHWIDVGQPDERRLLRASPRAARVSVYSFSASTPIWWAGIATRITRAANLDPVEALRYE